jgi:hypothetical protein
LIGRFLRAREGHAPGLLRGHYDFDLVDHEGQKAEILEQPAACGQRTERDVGHPVVLCAARIGAAQQEDRERGIDERTYFTM